MQSGYEAPDIDTESALRQAGATSENFIAFQSVRSLPGSAAGLFSYGTRTLRPSTGAAGDLYFETDRTWLYYYSGTAWLFLCGLSIGTDATRAAITVSANDNGASFFTTDTGKLWHVSGGAWVDRFVTLTLTTSLKVGANKVIGAQGASVADPTGGAVVDVECRTQLSALLAQVRAATGHGLIA